MMRMAEAVAETSYAVRTKVGAVIASRLTEQPVAMGYNGMPSGVENVCEYEDDHGNLVSHDTVIHAEVNAIQRISSSTNWDHYSLFVSHSPCPNCAKKIVNSGIKQVFYRDEYRLKEGIQYLIENGIEVFRLGVDGETVERVIEDMESVVPPHLTYVPAEFTRGYLLDNKSPNLNIMGYGILKQRLAWTYPEKKMVRDMFLEGKSVAVISRTTGRSFGSLCNFLVDDQKTMSYKQHVGYMISAGYRVRDVWCSCEEIAADRTAMDLELKELTPQIVKAYRELGVNKAMEKFAPICSPHMFMKALERSQVVFRYNPNREEPTYGSRAGWVDIATDKMAYAP